MESMRESRVEQLKIFRCWYSGRHGKYTSGEYATFDRQYIVLWV